MKQQLRRSLLCVSLCVLFLLPFPALAVETSAASAILMDAGSGRVLYGENIYDRRSIASTTKLLTALVAVERAPGLSAPVAVDPEAVGIEGTSLTLTEGEVLTVEELLYGLLLKSGNDAAVALAIGCAGDPDTFVDWMNEKAQALGMAHSHFANPNGLEAEGHYSCAYDMALLARAVLAHPVLARVVATKEYSFGSRSLTNHNKLLWNYDGCIGLKTGYTVKAGRTLVSAARRDGVTLIAVTLNDPKDWDDHAALFDYGFETWHSQILTRKGKSVALLPVSGALTPTVPVYIPTDLYYPLAPGEQLTARIQLPSALEAPVTQGDPVGRITFYLDGAEIGHTDLLAAASVSSCRLPVLQGLRPFSPLTLGPLAPQTCSYYRAVYQDFPLEGG